MSTIIRTYSIDEELYNKFKEYAKRKSLNVSKFISNKIQEELVKDEIDKLKDNNTKK